MAMFLLELGHTKCKCYLIASRDPHRAAIVDPRREDLARCLGVLAYYRLELEYVIDTHTHADHRSGAAELSDLTGAPLVMHRRAPSPHVAIHVEDGRTLAVGDVAIRVLYTPGHTPDSISLQVGEYALTGDCLMIHGTGRADFAGGDAGAQYDSITGKLFALTDATIVLPAHDYRGHKQSTIGEEKRSNPRLLGKTRDAYIELMNNLGLPLPDGIQEALQPNQSEVEAGQIKFPNLAQLNAVRQLAPPELRDRITGANPPVLIDVREAGEYRGELGHIEGAILIPLAELADRAAELEQYQERDIVAICRVGVRSSTAAAILTGLGFDRVWNLRGGMLEWADSGMPVER
ncbi:MAG TPA: MBL fold metallo-hydrolase [Candidatus Binataceae bacterium]|nr:MBL fold metallo-hydrolase [Candidatus Binataceae bacterium]